MNTQHDEHVSRVSFIRYVSRLCSGAKCTFAVKSKGFPARAPNTRIGRAVGQPDAGSYGGYALTSGIAVGWLC